MNDNGPIWQMEQAAKAEELKAIAYDADVKRYESLRAKALADAEVYKWAAKVLKEAEKIA